MTAATFERGLNTLREQIDAPVASFFTSCVRCGMCADACEFYDGTGDPKYTPINKVEPLYKVWQQEFTLWGRLMSSLGLTRPLTDDDLAQWQELIYDSCTLCGRCSMVCPVGNDITVMIRKVREGMAASGNAPEGLIGASKRAVKIGSPMGVKYPALQAQIRHIEKDTGLEIPLDRKGAEYMALLSSMEIMNFPEYIEALARIFRQARVTWTISSEAFEATNSGIQIGSSDIATQLVSRVVAAAEKLEVRTVISPECGHAYLALRWEGPNLIGRPYRFSVVHILELLDELRAQGCLKTNGRTDDDRLTYHDPCQISRCGGVVQQPRNLLNMFASEFVEMDDHGTMNWCCGGGGGVSSNERAEPLKLKVFKRKKAQLDDLGVAKLVTACANCRITIEEALEENDIDLPVVGLTELVAEHLLETEDDGGGERTESKPSD